MERLLIFGLLPVVFLCMSKPARSDLRSDYDQMMRRGQDRLSKEEECIKNSKTFNYVGVYDPFNPHLKGSNDRFIKVSEQGYVFSHFDMENCIEKGIDGWILLGSIGSTTKNGTEIHREGEKICLYARTEYGIRVNCFEKRLNY